MIDLTSLRARFPLLEERLYCATPGLGPVLRETYEDLEAYRRTFARRSRALEEWVERYEETILGVALVLVGLAVAFFKT